MSQNRAILGHSDLIFHGEYLWNPEEWGAQILAVQWPLMGVTQVWRRALDDVPVGSYTGQYEANLAILAKNAEIYQIGP